MNRLKRAFSISLMVVTVLSMSLITAPVASAQSAEAGDLIKIEGYSPVYYLGADGQRYVFPNESTYFSWYEDFSSVVTLPQEEVESYDLAANVTVRPGTNLVKRPVPTDPKVYAVTPDAELVWIPDAETAVSLYGENWEDRLIGVPDSFFVDYDISDEDASADTYPAGTLVQPSGSNDIYYINGEGEAQLIDDEAAFEANRFQWDFVTQAGEDYELPAEGDVITGAVDTVIDTSQGGGAGDGDEGDDEPAAGSGLTVALSNNTPSSATVPEGAAKVAFATFNLTASNDGPVNIDELTLTRVGVGDESELGDAYLYEGTTKVGDAESISTDNLAEFMGLDYTIPAGETKTLTVRVNIATNAAGDADPNGNHGFAIKKAEDIVTNGASVSGSFPIQGSIMGLSGINAGSLTFDFESVNGTVKVGENQKDMAEFKLLAGSAEDVAVQAVTLTNEGSADLSALENFKLYANNDVVAEVASNDSDELAMQFDEPYLIESDDHETFTLKADIDGETGENIQFELDSLEDVVGLGQTYGYYVGVATGAGDLTTENTNNAVSVSIETGDLTVAEADDNPSAHDAARGESDVTFLKAELTAEDQTLTVTDFVVDINLTTSTPTTSAENFLENITVYLDGDRVAGPDDVTFNDEMTTTSITFSDELDLDGVHQLELQADFTEYARYGDYTMTLDSANMTVEDQDGDEITSGISGSVTGSAVTVGSPNPTLSLDSTYSSQDVVSGEEILAGKFILEAADAEAFEIDNYQIDLAFAGGTATLTASDIQDLRVNEEDYITSPDASNNDFSVSEELAAGEQKVVEVYLTISDDVTSDNVNSTVQPTLTVEGQGKVSGDSDTQTQPGQTMTLADGSLTESINSATPDAAIMLAESEGNEVGKWEFEASNVDFNITEVVVTAYASTTEASTTVNQSAVTSMNFGDATTMGVNGVFTFDTDITVEKGKDVKIMGEADFNDIDNIADGENQVQFAVTSYKAKASNETVETEYVGDTDYTLNDMATNQLMEVYDSKITVSSSAGDTSSLGNKDNYIMEVTVTNDGGANNSDAILETMEVETDIVSDNNATITAIDLLDSNDESVLNGGAVTTAYQASATTSLDILEADGTISSGDSKTYRVVVTVAGADADDSITAQILESGFTWGDDNDSGISGSLVDKLPTNTYELIR